MLILYVLQVQFITALCFRGQLLFRGLRFRGLCFRGLRFRGLRFRDTLFTTHPTETFSNYPQSRPPFPNPFTV